MNLRTKESIISAGKILEEGFNTTQSYTVKERYHLQSEYDLLADKALKKYIKSEFPTYSIYSEETEEIINNRNKRWIIDPIDGTSYFIFGEPFFTISMAREINGEIVEAHVYNPITKEYYYSDKEIGKSYLNDIELSVSKTKDLEDSLLAFGFSANPKIILPYLDNFKYEMENCKKALPWIAPAISICNVARGRIEAFIDYGCSYEGQAAASLILKNAGGNMINIDYNKYDHTQKGGFFTNGNINLRKK